MSKENCELILRAKSLAIKRGLDDTKVECPVMDICKGTRCHLFSAEDSLDENWQVAEDIKRFEKKDYEQGV